MTCTNVIKLLLSSPHGIRSLCGYKACANFVMEMAKILSSGKRLNIVKVSPSVHARGHDTHALADTRIH